MADRKRWKEENIGKRKKYRKDRKRAEKGTRHDKTKG